ncbi:dihydrodipicolinate synthase family protein [Actinophytocola sp.]|uniref:dihydrodipicolinate synthase family protein n=1 Tax=Actinophytocola sp. TaxID=1872138 RepID=UPI003D6B87AA
MYAGTIVPLVTPLGADGAVSESDVDSLVGYVHRDVTALMPALSSGEGEKLSERQWHDAVAATVAHSRGLPVLAGILLPETGQVVRRARLAERLGASAVVVGAPFGADVTQAEILRHYQVLRDSLDVALFVYNESIKSANTIEPETLLRILDLPGVVGIKESSGSVDVTRRLLAADHAVPVFEGWENLLLEARGVAGLIGPLANLEPAACNAMLADPCPERQDEIDELCKRFGIFTDDWYRCVKEELHTRGVIGSAYTVDEIRER